ncbi:hypothetical protein ZWY2020_057463 [Hordeum vulgare]|nr:hypothetical protein ZWY2020_057463 [Hordeum vulgare]
MTASSSSSLPAATSSETKSSTPPVKTLATAERAPLPSPSKIIAVPSASEGSDEYDDETLQAIIRNKQERVAQASIAIPPPWTPRSSLTTSISENRTPAPTPQPLVEEPADASPHEEETPQAEEVHQERRVDEPAIEEIITETPTDEIAAADETAPDPAASSKQADDSVPAGSSIPAEETVERTPSPKASKVKKIIPSASDVKKTRAAEKEAKKRKASSAVEETEAKRLKESEETAPLDPVPLNVAPSYEMVVIDDPAKKADEEMKDVTPEEHTDEEIHIDDSPQPLIPHTETAQASAALADETASPTKPAEEKQAENPHADEIQHSDRTPQDEEQAHPTPPTEKEAEIPQPEAQPEQASSPRHEVPADEIPHPEENAEENVPAQDNAFIMLNPETAIVVSSPIPQQNLQPVQRQPFSKRPKFQKENFFEERMYFIGENPYDKPQMRHLKFWTRTQMNYYASVLYGRNKIFQRQHIPHVELEAIPCPEPPSPYSDACFLPMCSTYRVEQ